MRALGTGMPSERNYRQMIARSDALIRQNFAVMYPDIVDKEKLYQIQPEDFDVLDGIYADAQNSIDEEKKRAAEPKMSTLKDKLSGYKSRAGEWMDRHPTLVHGAKIAGAVALSLLTIMSAIYMTTPNARAQEFTEGGLETSLANNTTATGNITAPTNITVPVNNTANYTEVTPVINGFRELIFEGREYAADTYINESELARLRLLSDNTQHNLTGLDNSINNGKLGAAIAELLSHGATATDYVNKAAVLGSAYPLFDNINATLAKIDNASLEAQLMIKGMSAENSAIATAMANVQANISAFKKIYNATLAGYKSDYGPEVCYNLLSTLQEPAQKISDAKAVLATELMSINKDMKLLRENLLSRDLSYLTEDGVFTAIDGTNYTVPANALVGSLKFIEDDLAYAGDAWYVEPWKFPDWGYWAIGVPVGLVISLIALWLKN